MNLIKGLICPFGLTHPSTVPSSSVQVSIDFNGRIILVLFLGIVKGIYIYNDG